MSNYQVTNYGICGECRHHKICVIKSRQEWTCNCIDSDYYTDITDYTDTCDCFEQRGIDNEVNRRR